MSARKPDEKSAGKPDEKSAAKPTGKPAPAGYSGTPLPQKLGIKPGCQLALRHAPDGYLATLGELPPGVKLSEDGRGAADVVQFFTTSRAELAKSLKGLGKSIFPDGALWISWPKKSSGVPSDLDENGIRELCLPLGLVDVKVCAVDATWSGLKLMWRKELRDDGKGARRGA